MWLTIEEAAAIADGEITLNELKRQRQIIAK
jgi:hypothetical protein